MLSSDISIHNHDIALIMQSVKNDMLFICELPLFLRSNASLTPLLCCFYSKLILVLTFGQFHQPEKYCKLTNKQGKEKNIYKKIYILTKTHINTVSHHYYATDDWRYRKQNKWLIDLFFNQSLFTIIVSS